MSAGAFTRTFYEMSAENGSFVVPCRVQDTTLAASFGGTANSAPSGPADFPASATISQGKRSAGVNMRTATIAWTGSPPAGYKAGSTISIPVLKPTTFAAWTKGTTGTYLGANAVIAGKSGETVG
jgi:hypothetical protein